MITETCLLLQNGVQIWYRLSVLVNREGKKEMIGDKIFVFI